MRIIRLLPWLRPTACVRPGGWLAWLLVLVTTAAGSPVSSFQATPDSRVRISGRATIGSWECETGEIVAAVEPGPELIALAAQVSAGTRLPAGELPAWDRLTTPYANITIPVASLRCAKPGMRTDVLHALRHEEAPLIVFVLRGIDQVQVQPSPRGSLGRYHVRAQGDLVLAGTTRPIEISAEVVQETPDRFRIRASRALQMSDFGITAPTALLGLIRVDNTVTVSFDLTFAAIPR